MNVAQMMAQSIRRRYRLNDYVSDQDLDRIFRRLRLTLLYHPFYGRTTEVVSDSELTLRNDLAHAEQRWLRAHGLFHYLYHFGSHLRHNAFHVIARQDRQAEVFTGWLFLAPNWTEMLPWELAEFHQLPEARITRWFGLVAGEAAVSAGW